APAVARELERVGVRNLQDLEVRRVGTRSSWDGLTKAIPVPMNSDYAPVLDQGAVRARFLLLDARPLTVFEKQLFPMVEMLSGVLMPGSVTQVTPTPYLEGARRAGEGMALRDLLLGRPSPWEQVIVSDELRGHARAVSEWLGDCDKLPVPLTSLVRVGQSMVAVLTSDDLDAVWWALSSTRCLRPFSPQAPDSIPLLPAICGPG